VAFAAIVLVQDFFKFKNKSEPVAPRPYLVVLSIDGFRHDYQQLAATPTLDSIELHGVKAAGLKPVFPTVTFPNHYSIATGTYPENHGLVHNYFYTPKLKKVYSYKNEKTVTDGRFYMAEPIWVTAESQRVKAGCYYWVGSEAKIKGYHPSYYLQYNSNVPNTQRADSVIAWLNMPYGKRPNLIMWYINDTDRIANDFAISSEQMKNGIVKVDQLIAHFMAKANMLEIKDSLNFVIVSDHGMRDVRNNKVLDMSSIVPKYWTKAVYGGNPYYMIEPAKKCADSIYNTLKKIDGLNIYYKNEIPNEFHIANTNRITEIVVLADSNITLLNGNENVPLSAHGYNNSDTDMYGVFYGIGPAFKHGYNAGYINSVDLYNLFSNILQIKGAPNDGNFENVRAVLR